jgi:hypothetical protein
LAAADYLITDMPLPADLLTTFKENDVEVMIPSDSF